MWFFACVISEFVGRSPFFAWGMYYQHGVFMHMSWALIYSFALTFYYSKIGNIELRDKLRMFFVTVLIFYQLIMSNDCVWSGGNATFMHDSYKYIIIVIHSCIVSTFIKKSSFIRCLDGLLNSVRCVFNNFGGNKIYEYNYKCDSKKRKVAK